MTKTLSLVLLGASFATGCGKSACEELEEKQCDCHDEICDEAELQDTNKESEEVCEEALANWDCEEEMANRGLEPFEGVD